MKWRPSLLARSIDPLSGLGLAAVRGTCFLLLLAWSACAQSGSTPAPVLPPRFRVLALAEAGGHHVAFTQAAKPWLKKCGQECGFDIDYIENTATPLFRRSCETRFDGLPGDKLARRRFDCER